MGRGHLKIFLGAAPGVGKTFAMLDDAHQMIADGRSVVAGVIEDHGRRHTRERAAGIPLQPRVDDEPDVAALIARNPDVVLIDEFAHSRSTPDGPRKRWMDVEELLAAGIDVSSTLNIQHLQSLNDVVERITGVPQKETVPDAVVRAADTIELVDLSPEFLRTRLAEGLIYRPERVDTALGNYFRMGNLTALRELALLWLADRVEESLARYRADNEITEPWETRERVVVAVSDVEDAEPLIRRGRRIASKSSAQLLVVHVISGDGYRPRSLSLLPTVRELASDVEASVHQVTGDSVPDTLLQFARSVNATQLVLGSTRRPRLARIVKESTAEAVADDAGRIDVHLVNLERRRTSLIPTPPKRFGSALRWASAVIAPALVVASILLINPAPNTEFLGLIAALFFGATLVVSLLCGTLAALVSALLSALAMNWFFTPPIHTFTISNPVNAVTATIMMATALAVGLLVDRAREAQRQGRAAAAEADLLSVFSRSVLKDGTADALMAKVGDVFGADSVAAWTHRNLIGSWTAAERHESTDVSTDTVTSTDESVTLVLEGARVAARHRGVLGVAADRLAGLIRQEALARQAANAEAVAATDELRRALLTAVSHDLRTPLAAATLSVSSLRDSEVQFSAEDREELLVTVEEALTHLNRILTNLLDSSRLSAGVIRPRSDEVSVELTVQQAVAACALSHTRGHVDRITVAPSLRGLYVRADAALLERVLVNLIDNSLEHAPAAHVSVEARRMDGRIAVIVRDDGPGFGAADVESLFRPFSHLDDREARDGVGLGLTVVQGFVEAMDGEITLTNDGGAVATVTLPEAQS